MATEVERIDKLTAAVAESLSIPVADKFALKGLRELLSISPEVAEIFAAAEPNEIAYANPAKDEKGHQLFHERVCAGCGDSGGAIAWDSVLYEVKLDAKEQARVVFVCNPDLKLPCAHALEYNNKSEVLSVSKLHAFLHRIRYPPTEPGALNTRQEEAESIDIRNKILTAIACDTRMGRGERCKRIIEVLSGLPRTFNDDCAVRYFRHKCEVVARSRCRSGSVQYTPRGVDPALIRVIDRPSMKLSEAKKLMNGVH